MPHSSSSPTSRSPASRASFAGSLGGGMATPTPDHPPPLGIRSGLPLIRCPDCGGAVVEVFILPGHGGSVTGDHFSCGGHWIEPGVSGSDGGGCSFFKTEEEYKEILRDRGLLGSAATPEQGKGYLVQAPSGFLVPEPVGNPKMVTAMEDLKHEMAVQKLAIAQLKTDIEDFLGVKGKLGAGDKAQKAAKTDSLARWAKAIEKWFFVANVVALLFGMVVAMSLK